MKWLKNGSLFLLIALGFAPEFSGWYARLFGSSVHTLAMEEVACHDGGTDCRTRYQITIPLEDIRDKEGLTIGLGVLVPSAKVYCPSDPKSVVEFGNPSFPGESTSESIIKYQYYSIRSKDCERVFVDVFAPKEFRRFGKIGGQAVIGDLDEVKRIQKFNDFFLRDFKVICFFFLLFLLALSAVYSNVYAPLQSGIFDYPRSFLYWALFLGISSGIAVVFIPIQISPLILVRATSFFSILTHIGPIALLLANEVECRTNFKIFSRNYTRFRFTPIEGAISLLCLSPYFALSQGPLSLCFGLIGVGLGIRRKDFYVSAFSIALVVNGAAFYRMPFAPSFSLTILVALHCLAHTAIITLVRGRRLLEVSFWVKASLSRYLDQNGARKDLAYEYLRLVSAKQLTVCLMQGDQISLEQYQFKNGALSITEKTFKELPPVFAHILSTGNELWNVHVDSPLHANIYKGEKNSSSIAGRYFSAFPLYKAENLFGFISVTGYDEAKAKEDFEAQLFKNATKGVIEVIEKSASVSEDGLQVDRLLAIAGLSGRISGESFPNIDMFSEALGHLAGEALNCRAIVYHLAAERVALTPRFFSGFSEDEIGRYRKWIIYTVNQNEQGPAALAVSRQSSVLVPNLSFIESVLYHETVKVMKAGGVSSVCAIPLIRTMKEGKEERQYVWGLLWLESKVTSYFHPVSKIAFQHLRELLKNASDKVFQRIENEKIQRRIDGLIPARVKERWLNGESVEESRKGFLAIADIRGSTKISKTIGGSAWLAFAGELTEEISKIASKYDFELASWSWDAFHLLRDFKYDGEQFLDESVVLGMSDEIEMLVRKKVLEKFPSLYDPAQLYYTRVCVGSGDIATGIIRGVTDSWGIIGACMAVVTKMEQAAKAVPGRVFLVDWLLQVRHKEWNSTRLTFAGSENIVLTHSRALNAEIPENPSKTEDDRMAA